MYVKIVVMLTKRYKIHQTNTISQDQSLFLNESFCNRLHDLRLLNSRKERGSAQTGSDYAVHIMHTGEDKHEAAMQERKEMESKGQSIFQDCIWDEDYF